MPTLHSRLGTWELPHVHSWSERSTTLRAPIRPIVDRDTVVATIGSCFASELADAIGELGLSGGMHPGGLFYSTATIRQELERLVGGWPERDAEPAWRVGDGFVDPFASYDRIHPSEDALVSTRAGADEAAASLFRGAGLVVVTVGLIETWRNPVTGTTYRQIPHPAVFPSLGAEFYRLTVAEMASDLDRIRTIVRDELGAELVITTSPVPLHATFTGLDVQVANTESKSRIRAAVSEFVDRHPDVHYFHSYEMVMTAERRSDYFREDGRHVHRHAVRYIVSEFVRLFADPALASGVADSSWLTPIEQLAPDVKRPPRRAEHLGDTPATHPAPTRAVRERIGAALGRNQRAGS
jgi:hypothetical protein